MELEELKPVESQRVMDLVAIAGIDISEWANFKGGKEKAASNPKYCYDWSYVNDANNVIVLNLWYSDMEIENNTIIKHLNLRKTAESVKGLQSKRAFNMDFALQKAVRKGLSVRVIVCDGEKSSDIREAISHVQKRLLDTEHWYISEYSSETGDCKLVRGSADLQYVDQFEVFKHHEENPQKKEIVSKVFERSPVVRKEVLKRAAGHCEWCGEKGFINSKGEIYLETHHIIPLSEEGNDTTSNVIALCPNHHREAHFGLNAEKNRTTFLEILNKQTSS